ncbi:MAG: carboxy terminal-processing peptidase, partial [Xanthomonadaceae bacterium]|nr:carboxy terminal-processing peptidase [Xanthomonadaceae bacterium]
EVLPAESGIKGPPVLIELVRNEVKLEEQAAKSSIQEIEVDGELRRIGIIDVPVFYVDFRGRARNEPDYRSSTRDVRRLIHELEADGIEGLVIDLRGNGGGALVEATTMTGLFIDEGPVVQVRDAGGRVTIEADREPGMSWDGPLAVLVDRSSASASEIFAAALQDYGRGIVIGEATFGKGTVQNLFNLDNYANDDKRLGQVKLTMAKFFRIDGGSTQSRGVVPDIELPTFTDPTEYGESALDYALEWSQIEQTDYQPLANLAPLTQAARKLHLARRESDEELQELIKDYGRYAALRERTSISLLESERLKEHEESEDRRRARFGHDDADIEGAEDGVEVDGGTDDADSEQTDDGDRQGDDEQTPPDILLKESARILVDLIELDRDQHRLVQVAEPPTPGSLD